MKNRNARTSFITLALVGSLLLGGAVGCVETLLATHAGSFVAGWVVGASGVQVTQERLCYVNGEQVDCSTVNP